MEKIFVCPLPYVWHQIYQSLHNAWESTGQTFFPPPRPLVLSGWNFSNDIEKKQRWDLTVAWAKESGFDQLIPELTPEESYSVYEPTSYTIGPMGGPIFLRWNFNSRVRPSPDMVNQVFQRLKDTWIDVVGCDLAIVTKPLRFTGRKRRRLLIWSDPNSSPPWGSWRERSRMEEERHTFTYFRQRINEAIKPLEVDHIDFIHDYKM